MPPILTDRDRLDWIRCSGKPGIPTSSPEDTRGESGMTSGKGSCSDLSDLCLPLRADRCVVDHRRSWYRWLPLEISCQPVYVYICVYTYNMYV